MEPRKIYTYREFVKYLTYWQQWGTAVLQIVKSVVRFQLVSLKFFIDIKSFQSHYVPGVDSVSNRNEYQEYFLGGKGGWCVGLQPYHLHVQIFLKSGSLKLLEPSGPP